MQVRQLLSNAKRYDNATELAQLSYLGLSQSQQNALKLAGCKVYAGKVRDVIFHDQKAIMLHTDRLSAFDCFVGYVPFRGQVLAILTKWWADCLRSHGIPVASMELIHPRAIRSPALTPIRIEMIVRGYVAGNLMREYQKGERTFCGTKLPEGLTPYQKLPQPIITPTTKAEAYQHDEPISPEEIVQRGLCTQAEWDLISRMALRAYNVGSEVYQTSGWLLVDTKYEFGRATDGAIQIMDEIHTPDSSRLWEAKSYDEKFASNQSPVMLDKEIVRRWLVAQGFSGQGTPPKIPSSIIVELANAYLDVAEAILREPIAASISAPDPVGLVKAGMQ